MDQRVGLAGLQGRTRLRRRCLRVNVAVPGIAGIGRALPGPRWSWSVGSCPGFLEVWSGVHDAPWRDVPERCGPWESVYGLFRRWQRDGSWARIMTLLSQAGVLRHFASGTSAAVHAAQDGVPLGLCRIRAEMHVGNGKARLLCYHLVSVNGRRNDR